MELILQGWLGYDEEHNLGISQKRIEESLKSRRRNYELF